MASGGFVRPFPTSVADQLHKRGIPEDACRVLINYAELHRTESEGAPRLRGAALAKKLASLESLAAKLANELYHLPNGADDALWNAAHRLGCGEVITDLRENLRCFDRAIGLALRSAEYSKKGGHPGSRLASFGEQVADILESNGLDISDRANGPFCQALGILLKAMGERSQRRAGDIPDPREIAREALDRRQNRALNR